MNLFKRIVFNCPMLKIGSVTRGLLPATLILAILCSLGPPVQAGQLYRYTDEKGTQVLSGNLPPEAAQGEYEILNDQTMLVIKRVPPAKTKKQLAEEARLAKIEAEKQRQAREQANYDHTLLATFSSETDLLRIRDNQVEAIEGLIKLVQGKIKALRQTLIDYQNQAAHLERSGQPLPQQLLDNIRTVKGRVIENRRYIAGKRQEQKNIEKKFAKDLKRFRELRQPANP